MFLLGLRLHLMRNQSILVPGGVWLQGSNLKELTEGHHQEWSLRIILTDLFLDSMGGGAWPFLVGGAICLVNFVNERDLSQLISYAEVSLCNQLLRGTMAF